MVSNNRSLNNRTLNTKLKTMGNSETTFFSTSTFVIIIVILFVFLLGVYLYRAYKDFQNKAKNRESEYSTLGQCPDYWEIVDDNKCRNTHLLSSCSNTVDSDTMDFSDEIFTHPKTGNYAKCKWAKGCNVEWTGIKKVC